MRVSASAPTISSTLSSAPRDQRMASENRRVRINFAAILSADHRLADFGPDPFVDQLLAEHGFVALEAFARRLHVRATHYSFGKAVTAVVVLGRVWHRAWERQALRAVVRQAALERTRCIVVPQRVLAAPNRIGSAKVISNSRHVHYTATERMKVLAHLSEVGWSSLGDCAGMNAAHVDPAGIVLAMVSRGELKVDRSRRLDKHSRVDLVG
jgi:hypothetical protein